MNIIAPTVIIIYKTAKDYRNKENDEKDNSVTVVFHCCGIFDALLLVIADNRIRSTIVTKLRTARNAGELK